MTLADDNITDAEVVVSVESTAAPIEELPACTRECLLQPPDWRYQEALAYIKEPAKSIPSDPVVQYVARALKGHESMWSGEIPDDYGNGNVEFLRACWPILSEVLELGTFMRHSAITSQIEVSLIKGWTHDEARQAGCPVRKEVYDLYSLVFFDLTGARAVHAWMQDFLFEPERYSSNPAKLRSMLLAYHGGGTSGLNVAVTGYLSTDECSLIKKLMKNERQKTLFDYIVKHNKLDPVTYTNLMETALKNMTEHDFQEHMKDRDDAGTGSLEELGVNLETAIRVYSQVEVADFNKAGIDFSNQYTKSLIEK